MSENRHLKKLEYLSARVEAFGEHFVIYADYASRLSRHDNSFTVLLQDMVEVAERNKKADEEGVGALYWVALDEQGYQITNAYVLEAMLTSSQKFLRLVKPFPMPEPDKYFMTKENLNISKIEGFSWHEK